MAALQCEICGGKLMAKAGGLFECEYCGMQYDKTRIQEMVQEIMGTVKVEGTVQVAGSVKVDGPVKVEGQASKENLLQRGRMALEDGQWDAAESCYNKILDMDPQCAEAYLGLAIAKRRYRKKEDYIQLIINPIPCRLYLQDRAEYWRAADLYQRAESLAVGAFREYLEDIRKAAAPQLEAKRQAEAAERAAKEERERRIPLLAARRAEVAPAKRLLRPNKGNMYVLTSEGTIRPVDGNSGNRNYSDAIGEWRDIQKFEFVGMDNVLLLDIYGNVNLMVCREVSGDHSGITFDCEEMVTDCSAVDISSAGEYLYVLIENGTLLCAEMKNRFGVFQLFTARPVADSVKEIYGGYCELKDGSRKRLCGTDRPEAIWGMDDELISGAGVCLDGTMVKDHNRYKPELEWNSVIDWAAHYGLMMDGTVYRATEQGCEEIWQNVAALRWGGLCNESVYAITNDGYLLNSNPQIEITVQQPLFESLDALKKSQTRYANTDERRKALEAMEKAKADQEAKRKAEQEIQMAAWRAAGRCQHCGGELKGFFGKKCVSCGKPKDY